MKKIITQLLICLMLLGNLINISTFADDNRFTEKEFLPKPDGISEFSEGLAKVRIDEKWGFVDTEGKLVIDAVYTDAENFSEGFAAVSKMVNGKEKYGFIDHKGNEFTDFKFSSAMGFSEGIAPVINGQSKPIQIHDEFGYADAKADYYDYVNINEDILIKNVILASSFSDGLARASKFVETGEIHNNKPVHKDVPIYINHNGEEVISSENIEQQIQSKMQGATITYYDLHDFSEGLASFVVIYKDNSSEYEQSDYAGFIDKTGRVVKFGKYNEIGNFSDGISWVKEGVDTNSKLTYFDKSFNTLFTIKSKYEKLSSTDFSDGLCVVAKYDPTPTYYIIDKKGNTLAEKVYQELTPFKDGRALAIGGDPAFVVTDKKFIANSKMSSWAVKPIKEAKDNYLIPKELLNNYNQNITRADFSKLIANCLAEITQKYIWYSISYEKGKFMYELVEEHRFDDTSDENIIVCKILGIINGKGNNKFAPYDTITREEAAALLMRTAKYLNKDIVLNEMYISYSDDANISNYAKEPIQFVSKLGIMNGVGNNTFNPKGPYTKEQAFVTINRLFNAVKK